MTNVRVFQLARDLNLSSQEVVERLRKLGVEVKTASSSIDEDTSDKLKRALKIDQLTSRKRRIYGSEEDEAERELQEQAAAARIAAEKDERERAAAEAAAAAEARKHKKPRVAIPPPPGAEPKASAKAAEEPPPALIHPPGAPRLAPKVIAPIAPVVEEEPIEAEPEAEEEAPEAEEPAEEVVAEAAAPEEAPAAEPAASVAPEPTKPTVPIKAKVPVPPPAVVAPPVATVAPVAVAPPAAVAAPAPLAGRPMPPRASGPVRPIAPPPPPPPRIVTPRPVSTTAPGAPMTARPNLPPPTGLPRHVRPIAPPRPIAPRPAGPHPTSAHPSGGALPRSPHPTAPGRPGMGGPPGSRPMSPFPGAGMRPVGRPSPKRNDRGTRGVPPPSAPERPQYSGPPRKITLTEGVTVKELGEKMADVKGRDIMKALIQRGIMATVNQTLDQQVAVDLSKEFGYEASFQSFEEEVVQEQAPASNPEDLVPRAPVVTVMGHVDHGKTSLLDAIRTTTVAAKEAGGITQHIGAYHVDVGSRKVVFLDTPGHEAFTLMRARGAKVTDIVVLVVAADDGVMPQTVEAMDHARAAGVPIIVAVNKIDKPDAQPDRVKQQLSDRGLMPEEWGGTTVFVNVSAKKKQNLEQLLEMILLVADLGELKANPKRPAVGTVLEARLDKGRGPVATILVQDGFLAVGDTVVAGAVSGRVRAITDDQGARLTKAGPSTPVELQGLGGVPEPGDQFLVVTDLMKAQSIVAYRQLRLREKAMAQSSKIKLEDLSRAIADGQLQELPLVVKADVQGSVEAVSDQLMKIPQQKIKLRIIRSGAGAISEGDVLLAAASDAVVIGFNVRPERKAQEAADRDKVEMRLYTVIYDAVEDIKKALEGLLAPTIKEVRLGAAEVREAFKISKVGTIAGTFVTDGRVNRNAQVRLLRDNVVIHTGKVSSLKRFKDDATEVKSGAECGIGIAGYNDIKPGDVIEFFTTEKVKETLA